jgi:predicted RNA binding protein YcfA (HicA-like mRNA interferase family)
MARRPDGKARMPPKKKKSRRGGPKKGPRLNRGPFTFSDLDRAIKRDGWKEAKHGNHPNYKHPTKRGKVQLDKKWDGIRANDLMFRSVARQAGLTNKELLRLLNGLDP